MSINASISIDREAIAAFCHRWHVKELALFGSAVRDDFRPDSDVDVLVVHEDDAKRSLFDHIRAEDELRQIFGREVDLVEKKAIRNPFRRHHILNNHEVVYGAWRARSRTPCSMTDHPASGLENTPDHVKPQRQSAWAGQVR